MPNIIFDKVCKGRIIYNDKQIITRDYLRFDIKYIIGEIINNKNNRKNKYISIVDNVKTYINIKYEKKETTERKKKSKNLNNYICPVDNSNNKFLNKPKDPEYFKNIINGTSPEKNYYKDINGNMFYYEDESFVILPDWWKFPIDNTDIKARYDMVDLYKYHFVMFIRKKEYTSLFNLDTVILEEAKETIINFYKKNFFNNKSFDEKLLNIYIDPDTKYNFILIRFNLFDNYKGYKYTSFIDHYKTVKLEELNESITNKDKLVYYKRFSPSFSNIKYFCEGTNVKYDIINDTEYSPLQIGGSTNKKYKLVGGNNIFNPKEQYEIVNYYAKSISTSPHCTEFIMVKQNDIYYRISIRSITYKKLRYDNEFKTMFLDKLGNVIDNWRTKKIIYKNTKDMIGYLPSYVEINVEQVYDYNPIIRNIIKETGDDYWKKDGILDNIKKILLDPVIIITMIYFNLKDYNPTLAENIKQSIKSEFINSIINNEIFLSENKNFIILPRTTKVKDEYVLWYYPKITIKDPSGFINLCKDISGNYTFIRNNKDLKESLKNFTDIYDVYNSNNFVHNLRHLTHEHKKEIDKLLYNFLKNKYDKTNLNNTYFSWCHYPNAQDYNIYHQFIVIFTKLNRELFGQKYKHIMLKDSLYNYIDYNNNRYFIWDKIKYLDYSKRVIYKITK